MTALSWRLATTITVLPPVMLIFDSDRTATPVHDVVVLRSRAKSLMRKFQTLLKICANGFVSVYGTALRNVAASVTFEVAKRRNRGSHI